MQITTLHRACANGAMMERTIGMMLEDTEDVPPLFSLDKQVRVLACYAALYVFTFSETSPNLTTLVLSNALDAPQCKGKLLDISRYFAPLRVRILADHLAMCNDFLFTERYRMHMGRYFRSFTYFIKWRLMNK